VQLTDLNLARRLERTEALANLCFVEARARLNPASGACWMEAAGAHAMFDGPDSPCTQTFGLGMFEPPCDEDLDQIEQFFASRGAPVAHEVCPLAGVELYARLQARGHHPAEISNVLWRELSDFGEIRPSAFRVRPVNPGEEDLYGRVAADGWREDAPEFAHLIEELGRTGAFTRGSHCFLAETDQGVAAASGSMAVHDCVALLAGASTIPAFRGRGAQRALLETRLRVAREHSCDIAMMGAAPGSASQRNAERAGFRIAYTRLKWVRA
jgi:GNAT superfamily N-acetyltransferase